jgi:myo-inositol-1(or 4)-monophosphatase
MHPILNIAFKAARAASKVILYHYDRLESLDVEKKGENDFVTEVDRQAEQVIIETVRDFYPDHAFLGEESGQSGDGDYLWIIDPLDGTTNYLHGHPHFSISIGIKHQNILRHGLVYDPLRDELFTATKGEGAFLNNKRMRVSIHGKLDSSLVVTGWAHNKDGLLGDYLKIMKLLAVTAGLRRSGSSALDFAYVAAGRFDALCELGQKPWDFAGGIVLVQEAGGVVGDFSGKDGYWEDGKVIAGNVKIFNELIKKLENLKG